MDVATKWPTTDELRASSKCNQDFGSCAQSRQVGSKPRHLGLCLTLAMLTFLLTSACDWLGPGSHERPRLVQRHACRAKQMLRGPKKLPKPIVKQKISPGRRLARIEEMIDTAGKIKQVKFEEARKEVDNMRKMRNGHKWWKGKLPSSDGDGGAYEYVKQYGGEISRWLPDILKPPGRGIWNDPLESEDLAMLFDAFDADLDEELLPVVVYGLKNAFKEPTLDQVTAILEGMAIARHTYDEAYKVVGETGAMLLGEGTESEIAEFGFALSLAVQRAPKQCFLTLKEGLQTYLENVPGLSVRLLAWACAEGGSPLPELFGVPSAEVPGDLAEHVWSTCSSVASETKNKLVAGWPLPIVEATGVLSELQMTSLVGLADENDLWRPSARRGGAALEGSPWTALLSSPEHRDHPTARALRQWTAELFKAPMENVEAVRLIRYRQGEGALAAHADARPEHDTSLWLSGQRLATVMLQLGALPDGAGGDLLFPLLEEGRGKQVALQPGSALVWPTTDRDGQPDKRAARKALPLQTAATKYVAMIMDATADVCGHVMRPLEAGTSLPDTLGLGCALGLRRVSWGACPDEASASRRRRLWIGQKNFEDKALEKSVKDVSPYAAWTEHPGCLQPPSPALQRTLPGPCRPRLPHKGCAKEQAVQGRKVSAQGYEDVVRHLPKLDVALKGGGSFLRVPFGLDKNELSLIESSHKQGSEPFQGSGAGAEAGCRTKMARWGMGAATKDFMWPVILLSDAAQVSFPSNWTSACGGKGRRLASLPTDALLAEVEDALKSLEWVTNFGLDVDSLKEHPGESALSIDTVDAFGGRFPGIWELKALNSSVVANVSSNQWGVMACLYGLPPFQHFAEPSATESRLRPRSWKGVQDSKSALNVKLCRHLFRITADMAGEKAHRLNKWKLFDEAEKRIFYEKRQVLADKIKEGDVVEAKIAFIWHTGIESTETEIQGIPFHIRSSTSPEMSTLICYMSAIACYGAMVAVLRSDVVRLATIDRPVEEKGKSNRKLAGDHGMMTRCFELRYQLLEEGADVRPIEGRHVKAVACHGGATKFVGSGRKKHNDEIYGLLYAVGGNMYTEAALLGDFVVDDIKVLVGSFPGLFGTELGDKLRSFCLRHGVPLAWGLGNSRPWPVEEKQPRAQRLLDWLPLEPFEYWHGASERLLDSLRESFRLSGITGCWP
ncbi:unnamed protein product [Symbiodinium microadriaticum]|nr:unnamed protein product [Symbiodinium microadriaticum]